MYFLVLCPWLLQIYLRPIKMPIKVGHKSMGIIQPCCFMSSLAAALGQLKVWIIFFRLHWDFDVLTARGGAGTAETLGKGNLGRFGSHLV